MFVIILATMESIITVPLLKIILLASCLGLLSSCSSNGSSTQSVEELSVTDIDNDAVSDDIDNCPSLYNPDQAASIGNTFEAGDACDDEDSDGIADISDNCPLIGNTNQGDSDGNGVGDACEGSSPSISDVDYFKDVALGVEFGAGAGSIRKWTSDIRYVIVGDAGSEILDEVNRIAAELNALISVELVEVFSEDEANFIVFFGSGEEYANNYESNATNLIAGNIGLFWNYWNGNFEMVSGSMYVATPRIDDAQLLKHIIREELTQAVGVFNDSFSYEDSIFYQGFSNTTEYAPIDIEVLELLYSPNILPGMNEDDVDRVLGLQ